MNTTKRIGVVLAAVIMLFVGLAAFNGTATAKQSQTDSPCYEQVIQYKYVKYTQTKSREGTRDRWNDDWSWGDWSSYSDWSKWGDGNQHLTWSNSNVEALNDPAEHGHWWDESNNHKHITEYSRQWQLRNTGETRVVNGSQIPCPTLPTTTVATTTEAPTTTKPDKKIFICHRDQGHPEWKVIEIAESALEAHLSHQWGEDIYPVPEDGCPKPPESTTSTTSTTSSTTSTTQPTTTTEAPTTTTEAPTTTVGTTTSTQPVTSTSPTTIATTTVVSTVPESSSTTEATTTVPSPSTTAPDEFEYDKSCGVFSSIVYNGHNTRKVFTFTVDGTVEASEAIDPKSYWSFNRQFPAGSGNHTIVIDKPSGQATVVIETNCGVVTTVIPFTNPSTTTAKPLPSTGSNTGTIAVIALLLIAVGGGLAVARRRSA